jgi:hypothetical protein
MAYTHEMGRQFWEEFDRYFKFEAAKNNLTQYYSAMGGYSNPGAQWLASVGPGGSPNDFDVFADSVKDAIIPLATEQEIFFQNHFQSDPDLITQAFQDFAFGLLASPNAPYRQNEPVHIMNGSKYAQDYLSWHGFNEAAIRCRPGVPIWNGIRWINGMAWELQVTAAPSEQYPNQNQPLPADETTKITDKWKGRTSAEIDDAFSHYADQTQTFKAAGVALRLAAK